jgi:hypothetical protein
MLAKTTLAVVLFAGASGIKARALTKSCEPVRPATLIPYG